MRAVKRILVVLLVLILFLGAGAFAIWEYMLGQISRPSETTAVTAGGTTRPVITAVPLTNPPPEVKGVTNLLLLGVDNRVTGADDAESLSDVMMIVTVDADNKVIKLTSLQRDMLVYVPGSVEPMKLTEAHLFGGPEMTMRVINESFRLDLKDYVEVNIYDSERLIDIVGGIDLTISAEILKSTNDCIVNQNAYFPDTPKAPTLKAGGMQHLSGRQAVAYARVRAVDSDYKRMGRQREVLQAVFYAFMDASLGSKGTMIKEGLGCIYTTLDNPEITRLAITVAPAMAKSVMQMQIPDPVLFGMDKEYVETIPGFNIRVDFKSIIPKLQQFIYNKTFVFDPVREIPGAPNAKLPLPAGHKIFTGVESLTPAPTTAATTAKPAATVAAATAAPPPTSPAAAGSVTKATP